MIQFVYSFIALCASCVYGISSGCAMLFWAVLSEIRPPQIKTTYNGPKGGRICEVLLYLTNNTTGEERGGDHWYTEIHHA